MSTPTTDQAKRLLRRFEQASYQLAKALGTKQGGVAAEANYSAAYHALVVAGLAPKLRRKYTRGGLAS